MNKIKNYIKIGLVFFGVLATFTSCKIGKSYVRPDLALPDSLTNGQDSLSLADLSWWQIYTDPLLVSLIEQALEYNKDVLIAAARVKELAAKKRIDTANLLPQITAGGSANTKEERDEDGNTTNSHTYSGNMALSWELDLFGNLRWSQKAGFANYLKSIEAQRAIQLTIISEVAQAYYELISLDTEMDILEQTLEDRKESIRLTRIRYDGGLTSEIPYQQAQVELARTATMIPEQEKKIKLKEAELSFLVGSYPKKINRSKTLESLYSIEELPYGLPSMLLERRPDIREAEQTLIAAHADVGVAYTDMFPKLTLTAKLGSENSDLSSFLKTPYSLIAGALTTPIFQMGKNRAAWKAKKAAYEQELYRYEKTVLNAFIETQNTIISYNKQREVRKLKTHLERASKKYVEKTHAQHFNGYINYIDELDAQRTYLDAQIGLNKAILDELLLVIQLYKTLGGGW